MKTDLDSHKPSYLSQSNILTVCGDPGGAAAIAPVIKKIKEDKQARIKCYAYNQGQDILKYHGITSHDLPASVDIGVISSLLKQSKISLLLTATSYNNLNWERNFIGEARKLGIFSFSILDFWSNYALRFSDAQGNLIYVPDKIAVMDDLAKNDMISAGFPQDCIVITGQPAFDALLKYREQFSIIKKNQIRNSIGIKNNESFIIFASQPLSEIYGARAASILGYDEKTVLEKVINSLEKISEKNKKDITLLIRPHPRESLQDFAAYKSQKIQIILSADDESWNLIMAADLIIGMTSIFLIEACFLGNIVVSLQPDLRNTDVLPTNKTGLSIGIYKKEEILDTLEKFLFNDFARSELLTKTAELGLDTQASLRIVNYIYSKIFNSRTKKYK